MTAKEELNQYKYARKKVDETLEEYQQIHQYKLTRDMIDIFTQMMNGRVFEEEYLKSVIRW